MQTRNILRQIIGAIFLVVLAACNAPTEEYFSTDIPQTATHINIDKPTVTVMINQNWMIVAKERAEEMGLASWLVESESFWTPSENDILELEEKLAGYLSQNPHEFNRQPPVWQRLDEYQRQYIGLVRDGKKIVYGSYFCSNMGINWRQDLVIVEDGGECYFQVEYDVDSGFFIKLLVNGES